MMDTSALVAALDPDDHQHHALSRPHLVVDIRLPAIVLAETFAQLRRTFGQSAPTATAVVSPLAAVVGQRSANHRLCCRGSCCPRRLLDLGGNIHDALIAQVCAEHDLPLVTLDGRQHRLALALGARSTYLLA